MEYSTSAPTAKVQRQAPIHDLPGGRYMNRAATRSARSHTPMRWKQDRAYSKDDDDGLRFDFVRFGVALRAAPSAAPEPRLRRVSAIRFRSLTQGAAADISPIAPRSVRPLGRLASDAKQQNHEAPPPASSASIRLAAIYTVKHGSRSACRSSYSVMGAVAGHVGGVAQRRSKSRTAYSWPSMDILARADIDGQGFRA